MGGKEYKRTAITLKLLGYEESLDRVAKAFLKAARYPDEDAYHAKCSGVSELAAEISEAYIWKPRSPGDRRGGHLRDQMEDSTLIPLLYYNVYCALMNGCITAEDIIECQKLLNDE